MQSLNPPGNYGSGERDRVVIRVALGRGGGVVGTDRHCLGVIGGADSRAGGVLGRTLCLSNRSCMASSLPSELAGEAARAGGFAIGLGITIAGIMIGAGVRHDPSPDSDGKLLSSNVTSQDR